jgi:UPF0716 protein FxsA
MNPLVILILVILGLPTLELYLLIEVGSEIGALPAVLLVVLTAVVGGILVQRQGVSTLMRVRQSMDRGELPALELLEGTVLLVGGLLLLIPGFFTDALGFLCLLPPLRRLFLLSVVKRMQIQGEVVVRNGRVRSDRQNRIIEGEFHKDD